MFDAKGLAELLRHGEWADAKLWQVVLDEAEGPLDDKVSFWLHHIHQVQRAFLLVWRGEPLELPSLEDFATPLDLCSWGREGHGELLRYLSLASSEDLHRELDFPWREQMEEKFERPLDGVTLAQSAMQVVLHSTHHRAQVASRLRELGEEPPMVDYIAWLWRGKPETQWDPSGIG
ncbi:MAG: hypothetical protein K0U98_24450 [Deltaproteobacteria bacterium]|nr:hypothetical protein [Deltaproteobacteria bacterium]